MAGPDNLADEWPPLRSLTDIALRHWNVRLRCKHCKHERVVSGAGLWWLFYQRRWPDNIGDVPRRLWCTPCRIRHRRKIMPKLERTQDAPTGDPLPDPDMYEWKKLIARYRS